MTNWLPITEYSSQYKVSVSTLRRRIKTGRVEFVYEDGKYLLKDTPLTDHHPNNQKDICENAAPPQHISVSTEKDNNHTQFTLQSKGPAYNGEPILKDKEKTMKDAVSETPIRQSNNSSDDIKALVSELKKAYALVLQEKEEQVMILKDEVADLQTLVRVFESENLRLKNDLNKFNLNAPRAQESRETRSSSEVESLKTNSVGGFIDPADLLQDGEWVHDLELE